MRVEISIIVVGLGATVRGAHNGIGITRGWRATGSLVAICAAAITNQVNDACARRAVRAIGYQGIVVDQHDFAGSRGH